MLFFLAITTIELILFLIGNSFPLAHHRHQYYSISFWYGLFKNFPKNRKQCSTSWTGLLKGTELKQISYVCAIYRYMCAWIDIFMNSLWHRPPKQNAYIICNIVKRNGATATRVNVGWGNTSTTTTKCILWRIFQQD